MFLAPLSTTSSSACIPMRTALSSSRPYDTYLHVLGAAVNDLQQCLYPDAYGPLLQALRHISPCSWRRCQRPPAVPVSRCVRPSPPGPTTHISMFLAPLSTTSSSACIPMRTALSSSRPSSQFFSRNSLRLLALLPPITCAFHSECVPAGSVWYSTGVRPSSPENPARSVAMPNGRTPPRCVYRCCVLAMYLARYSADGASSHVRRYDWASTRVLFIRTRASAVRPANARTVRSSTSTIFRMVRGSCSF